MANRDQSSLYSQVVNVTHVYLGPAADRFIARQIESHLHKPAEQLTRQDLASLLDWIHAVVGLISDDSDVVAEYIEELRKLTQERGGRG